MPEWDAIGDSKNKGRHLKGNCRALHDMFDK